MLLILSNERDRTTDMVCNWLNYYQFPFVRINKEQSNRYEIVIDFQKGRQNVCLKSDMQIFDFYEITKVWFRRGEFDFRLHCPIANIDNAFMQKIIQHIHNENNTLVDFLYYLLKEKQTINDPRVYNYNKLIALYEAQKLGFNIPPTLLSCDRDVIQEFVNKQSGCITKNIQDILYLVFENGNSISQSTQKVFADEITEEKYWYSLFQQEIRKKYELRIFYFLSRTYTAAIFSQLDKDSMIDSRQVDVNSAHPNRIVPFNLSPVIKKRINKLMKALKLESGSIDIIVDYKGNYYFLEVNPVGQFNYISEICNYYIEKDIAQNLLS